MRRQTKPFTVTVKRRRRAGSESMWSDTPSMAEMLAAVESDDEPEPALKSASEERQPASAPVRRPRILDSLAPQPEPRPVAADPALTESEDEQAFAAPVPRRRRTKTTKPRTRISGNEAKADLPPTGAAEPDEVEPSGAVTAREPIDGNAAAVEVRAGEAAVPVELLREADDTATAKPPRRMRTRNRPLRAGERWKRHLPRWKR